MKVTFVRGTRASATLVPRLRKVLAAAASELGVGHCALSVLLTDDEGIRDYNRRFRGLDEPTDVLSFGTESGDRAQAGHYLGDLVVSLERAAAQGEQHGHGVVEEAEVLVLHGLLHLLGHDHETDRGEMRALESDLALRLFGSARGLIARTEAGRP